MKEIKPKYFSDFEAGTKERLDAHDIQLEFLAQKAYEHDQRFDKIDIELSEIRVELKQFAEIKTELAQLAEIKTMLGTIIGACK